MNADRTLLLGMLALQNNFVDRHKLIAAFDLWTGDKTKPLGQILLAQGVLAADEHELLEALVAKHLERHGGDPEKSLADLTPVGSVRDELQRLADADIQASLAHVSVARNDDPHATQPWSAGESTSSGTRFRILRPHARGGLGEVYVARDEELHREVALKEIQERHAHNPDSRSRFLLEAEITGGLEHPGIVPVYGLGAYADGRPFYAMRFIKGDSLKEAIERFHHSLPLPLGEGRGEGVMHQPTAGAPPQKSAPSKPTRASRDAFSSLEFRKLLGRFIDVCNAIEYAHSRGVLHRDLKPGNIMLGKYGETLVVDWGLAKLLGRRDGKAAHDERTLQPSSGSGSSVTQMGSAVGTPQYMSPEQAEGRLDQLGPASDVYSLGATLYTILTGEPAFSGKDVGEILSHVAKGDFPAPRSVNADIPRPLEAICLKAMSLRPADRYATPRALADDAEHWLADEPVLAFPDTTSLRAARFARRHRAFAQWATAALLLVTLVSIVAVVGIDNARRSANKEAIRADREASAARLAENTAKKEAQRADSEAQVARLAEAKAREEAKRADQQATVAKLAESEAKEQAQRADREAEAAKMAEVQARQQAQRADMAANNASTQTRLAQRHLYVARMNLADASWKTGNSAETARLLNLYAPAVGNADELTDFRGFEWFYLERLCHASRLSLPSERTEWIAGVSRVIAFSRDGSAFAFPEADHHLVIYNVSTGTKRCTLRGHDGYVFGIAFSPDGQTLASVSRDLTLRIWDTSNGKELHRLNGHTNYIVCVAFSDDGRLLASSGHDGTIRLWDTTTWKEVRTITDDRGAVPAIAFGPKGDWLVSSSLNDPSLRIWGVETGELIRELKGHNRGANGVAVSPDGSQVASAGWDGEIRLWNSASGTPLLTLGGHHGWVNSVAYSQDGKFLATGGSDHTVRIWDAVTGIEIRTLRGHSGRVRSVAFNNDGQVVASMEDDGTTRLWDATADQEAFVFRGAARFVHSISFRPDGRVCASGDSDGVLTLWDVERRRQLISVEAHPGGVYGVAFSSDGRLLASGGVDGTAIVWNGATGERVRTLVGHARGVRCVAFNATGQWIASAGIDKTVRVWDTTDGREISQFREKDMVSCVAFGPDERLLAAGTMDEITLWDLSTGKASRGLRGHVGKVNSVSFSADGKTLLSAGSDGTIREWDVATTQELQKFIGHANTAIYSPDGTRITSASDRTIRVWDRVAREPVLSLTSHTHSVGSISFDPSGNRLASASLDGTVRIWDARPSTPELRVERQEGGLAQVDPLVEGLWLLRAREAYRARDQQRLAALAEEAKEAHPVAGLLQKKLSRYERLLAAQEPQSLATVPPDAKSVSLADVQAEAASTGWGPPLRNQVLLDGDASGLLSVGGAFYDSGLYAHAPARHAFRLDKKWQTLSTRFGLQDGHGGSVVFVIKGDGRELFRSERIADHAAREQTADVNGIELLELIVEDAGDGGNSDWGVWLDPRIMR